MPKNVVITPLSGLVDFYDLAGNLDAKIQISDAGDLSIGNTGGVLSLGNTASNVFIGDGVNSVDVIFEQNGAIRALTGKTLTLGNSASSVAIQSPLTINSPLLNTSTDGNFEIRQTVPGWTNSTSHPILKWSFNATYDDNLYLASGGNAAGTTQTALVVTELGGVIIGAGPSAPNSSSVVSTEWFRLDNSRFTITRNSAQSLTFENSDTTQNPNIISYSAANNAKNIIFDSKTDASNTAVSAGFLGYEFRVAGTSALTIATDRSSSFSNHVTPTGTNLYTLGSASLLWSNVYATTFTGALSGNASGSAATFTSTTQNSQFNSVGVGVAASTTAGRIDAGNIVSSGYVSAVGGVGQLQAVSGSASTWYNAFLRNDGTNVYLLSSAVQTTQALATNATWNAYRPFSWALTTGAVTIDGTGIGTTFGGAVTGTSFNSITGLSLTATAPIVAGTATGGTSTLVSRQDHVHPAQTTLSSGTLSGTTTIASARVKDWTSSDTSIDGLINGTVSGVLFEGPQSAHFTIGLRSNDAADGFQVISKGISATPLDTDPYTTLCFEVKADGKATAASFNLITGLSSTTPVVAGTAAVGTGTTAARGDHVHPAQTTVTTATNIAGGAAGSIPYQTATGATSLLATGTGVLIGGATPSYTTTPTLTGTNFTGIPNGGLTNSSITIGSTAVSLGGTITAISGLGVVAGTSFNLITGLSSTTPVVAATAAVGTGTTAARGDHVHPAQTTISGNAGTATTLATARTINGTSFNGSADIAVGRIYDTSYRRITNPGGAESVGQVSVVTGAIAVTLPVGMSDSMICMTIKVYEYVTNESFEINCGGYNYLPGTTWANSPFAYIVGNPGVDRRFTVRFGYDSVALKAIIYIGELASTWSYPQVYVTDVQVGYSGNSVTWTTGWTVGFEATAFKTVTATLSNCQVGYAVSTNTANSTVLRDGSGNFSAGTITATTFSGNATNATYATSAGSATNASAATNATYATSAGSATNASAATNATYATSAGNAATVASLTPVQFFNNMGDTHGTRTSFDLTNPSYGHGFRFIQGNTNGPGVNSATQYYSMYLGLGNDYPATGASSYGMQLAIPRNVTTPYLAIRYNESNSLGAWQKINAGYADSAGSATNASAATNATYATSAGSATNATFASSATNATYATSAGSATNATFASSATNATYATSAGSATNATYATSAGSATNASAATNAGSATNATNALRIVYADGPRDLSDRLPNSFSRTVNFDFVGAGTANGTGNYGGVMTFSPWAGTTASTGDSSYQLAFANLSGVNASGQPKLSIRNGIDSAWTAWYTFLHSGNYSSYAVPLSGGTMTGNLAINNASPTLYFQDTDNMTATLHCNSNIFYVLRHATANTAGWDSGPNGRHPMTLNLSSGDVTFSGNVTAYSDERLKKNINVISDPLTKVKSLLGVSFERLEGQKGIGLVAQNVKEVIPDVVTEDKEGYLSVAYGNIVGLLVEAIKEQQTIIDSQEERINRMEEMLNKLIKE